ncbi:alpha/beta fold hydrolase [Caulobacter sp. SLTY]|uniref:alpha/beta hydrolase n=1 Tax=Caulobacter sp. SLTY TaxID=2683262 RepID=UPI001411B6C1|nr:alpha/beta hydrolase [Caulobacter sp. SLTY]NBB16803.1 alpha/beta fold hydrolase [Caulobacter sp. SLTY]
MKRRAFLLSLTALGGCAPMLVQSPLTPLAGFSGPSLGETDFVSFDGARLGLTVWRETAPLRAIIVGLHGMNDYANAFHLAAPIWAEQGIATYAFDQRGFGRSVGRGIWAGRELMTEDLRVFVDLVKARHPGVPVTVVGESMGGAVAICAFAGARAPSAERLVLLAPAVWGWSSQPLPYKTVLWITARVSPGKAVQPPAWLADAVKPSDNIDELRAMGRDRLMIWGARPDTISGLVDLMEAAWKEIGGVKVPTAYLYGANDGVIPEAPSRQAASRLPAGNRSAFYAKGYHLLIRDNQRRMVIEDVAGFTLTPDAPLPSGAPPVPKP